MTLRQQRGKKLAETRTITKKKDHYIVPSAQGKRTYLVSLSGDASSCTCPDFTRFEEKCKHIYAAEYVEIKNLSKEATVVELPVVRQAKRKTYPQNWPAYNKAQTTEKELFLFFLKDLCDGIPNAIERKLGRPSIPLSEMLFCATYKVYSTFSARRFMSDLRIARNAGYFADVPCHNSVLNCIANPELTPILKDLIVESSLPLRAIERCFAGDSTGFSAYKFDRWFSHKYGKEKGKATWIKGHVMCGVTTNVITAVEIFDQHAHDAPILPALLKTTSQNFQMEEVSGDKGYLSESNIQAIIEIGATPYIALKSNTTGKKGSLLRDMYYRFMAEPEVFFTHYHRRSNIETTFSMVKLKFGNDLRSKSELAMINETLLKFICHNIVVLIHEMYERDIVPDFWQQKKAA